MGVVGLPGLIGTRIFLWTIVVFGGYLDEKPGLNVWSKKLMIEDCTCSGCLIFVPEIWFILIGGRLTIDDEVWLSVVVTNCGFNVFDSV